MIYTVTMNPAIDCATVTGALEIGRVNRTESQSLKLGGKGINVSHVLRCFGTDSILTGFTAGFTGDALESALTRQGYKCDFVRMSDGNTRINIKLTSRDKTGDPDTELNAPGPTPNEIELGMLKDKLSRLSGGDVLVIAGSLPPRVPAEYVRELAEALPVGVLLVCDLSGDALRAVLGANPDFVKPNVHELFDLFGIPQTNENSADVGIIGDCAEDLLKLGAKSALITMGSMGAYYISKNAKGFSPAPTPKCQNGMRSAVGCGDSTVAGWLIGMGYGGDGAKSLAMSSAGIDPRDEMAAAKLAVAIGSASYHMGFPASPDMLRTMMGID